MEYYYLWKKSERYDYFSQQTRLGRRKYGPSGPMYEQRAPSSIWGWGDWEPWKAPPISGSCPSAAPIAPSFYRDADQDLDSSDPDGPSHLRSLPPLPPDTDGLGLEQDPLTQMHKGENVGGSSLGSCDWGTSFDPGWGCLAPAAMWEIGVGGCQTLLQHPGPRVTREQDKTWLVTSVSEGDHRQKDNYLCLLHLLDLGLD